MSLESTLLEKRVTEAFDVFDNARSHEVDVRELVPIQQTVSGCVITEAELQEIQVEVEDVENNCVPQARFVEFRPSEPEDLLKAFQLLDPENRGFVTREFMEKAMMEIGEPFSRKEIDEMMAIACDAATNRIYYEHYIHLLIFYRKK
ncbi:EF-hand calcium-binding domain-containing protein 2-like [Orussus abietinus]|uniref:EF-hand calcium-binding domain-containing protein 2-like n=1 Tax=Orussus abietinus TaxID=222816 RepID=UPI000C715FD0|nr:EF-hand calcium-binding domain-containing protein 2-like [Orussus abietinus]